MQYKDSFTRTLSHQSEWYFQAKQAGVPSQEDWFENSSYVAPLDNQQSTANTFLANRKIGDLSSEDNSSNSNSGNDVPIRMSVDSTPEFMQLPLEYQGFCPWTIAQRGGTLPVNISFLTFEIDFSFICGRLIVTWGSSIRRGSI